MDDESSKPPPPLPPTVGQQQHDGVNKADDVAEKTAEKATAVQRRFFTIANAAVYTDLSTESIRRLVSAGKLTALRPVRGRILLDRQELDAMVRASITQMKTGRGKRPRP